MASFQEHINCSLRNLDFLGSINKTQNSFWDWQVTVAFYVAVHLMNAHIAQKSDLHYKTHKDVNNLLNPYKMLSVCKLTEENYTDYIKLLNYSRRARYLVNHDDKKGDDKIVFLTYDKHFSRSVKCLDGLMNFMVHEYKLTFPQYDIQCPGLPKGLKFFKEISYFPEIK